MKKLKNGFLDILLFFIYHIMVIFFSGLIVIQFSYNINVLDLDAIKKILLTKPAEAKPSSLPDERIAKPLAIIKDFRGSVNISASNAENKLAQAGQELNEKDSIETKEKSNVLISFGDKYSCLVRIGSNTKLDIQSLKRNDQETSLETSLFKLLKGVVSVMVTNKKEQIKIDFKTKNAVFGVRGTKFSIFADDENHTVLVVQEGKVEVQNLITFTKKPIPAGSTYLFLKDGSDKEFKSNNTLTLFDWDFNKLEGKIPEMNDLMNSLGNPTAESIKTVSEGDLNKQKTVSKEKDTTITIAEEIQTFKEFDQDLKDKLLNINDYLKEIQHTYSVEKPRIESDIRCLSKSKSQCDLYSEKILTQRGFPRTFGTPRLIASLIDDLKLHLREKEDEIQVSLKEKEVMEALIAKRKLALESILKQVSSGDNHHAILKNLLDPALKK